MEDLEIQFKKQLKPGTRVVSLCFSLPNIKPQKTELINGKNYSCIDSRAWQLVYKFFLQV